MVVREADTGSPAYSIRRSGDRHLLVEAGEAELDLCVRVWIHLLAQALRSNRPGGVTEIVEGVRSLLVAVDDSRIALSRLADHLASLTASLDDPATVTLTVREVTLPIAFDHPETHQAMRRYAASVRPDAPWCPDNVEFIRRVNDLSARSEVFDIVAAATYLVIGLGDVYLGAPVAVPIDPRHRLVTTKYNPVPNLDSAECRGNRRDLPVRVRHGRPRRLPAGRPDRADLADVRGRRAAVAAAAVRPVAAHPGQH